MMLMNIRGSHCCYFDTCPTQSTYAIFDLSLKF